MGGVGSGRYCRVGVKRTTEEFLWIDAQEWWHTGVLLDGGLNVHWGWPYQTGLRGTMMEITVLNGDRVLLRYAIPNGREQTTAYTQQIQMDSTPCHFGGERWWFRCPQDTCRRRTRRLYRGSHFFCRLCYGLNYQSQHEDRCGRLRMKAQNIREKLGGSRNLLAPFPFKPKGMHWQKYQKLHRTSEQARKATFLELENVLKRMKADLPPANPTDI